MKLKCLAFVLVITFLTNCAHNSDNINLGISGKFPALARQKLFLHELEVHNIRPVDSTEIAEDGSFEFNLSISQAGFYILRQSQENQLLLLVEKGENIFLNSENTLFSKGCAITGSYGSVSLMQFESHMHKLKLQVDSLANEYTKTMGSEDYLHTKNKLDSIYNSLIENHKNYIAHFVQDHPSSLASLIIINRKVGMAKVIDEEEDFSLLYRIDSALVEKYPKNKHVLDHHQRVIDIKTRIYDRVLAEQKLEVGKRAPDIMLADTSGQQVSLKMYSGNPLIIYFWAGWSAKSRLDNRRLVKLYDQLTANGVDILGISLDENESVWKGAMKLDQLPWKQVSDLRGLYAQIKNQYNVPDELPYYYLLDKNLYISYKNNELDSVLIKLETLSLSN